MEKTHQWHYRGHNSAPKQLASCSESVYLHPFLHRMQNLDKLMPNNVVRVYVEINRGRKKVNIFDKNMFTKK